jgi:hypothetical protein
MLREVGRYFAFWRGAQRLHHLHYVRHGDGSPIVFLLIMNKTSGPNGAVESYPRRVEEKPALAQAATAVEPRKRSQSMPELPVGSTTRGPTLAPVRSGARRAPDDSALALFRQTHEKVMLQVTRDLASAGTDAASTGKEGAPKTAPGTATD